MLTHHNTGVIRKDGSEIKGEGSENILITNEGQVLRNEGSQIVLPHLGAGEWE